MFDSFLAQVLTVSLIFFCCCRMFFTRHSKIDFLCILAPVSFVIAVLNFFIWGAEFPNVVLLCFSFITLILNVRSLLRFAAHLFVDHYSLPFVLFNLIYLLFAVFVFIMLVIYHPVKYSAQKYGVNVEKSMLCGSIESGFELKTDIFKGGRETGTLYKYSPVEESESRFEYKPSFVFVGSAMAPVVNYEPYFIMLAQRGYEVYAADIFPSDEKLMEGAGNYRIFRKQALTKYYFNDKDLYMEISKKEIPYIIGAYKSVSKIVLGLKGENEKLYFITDGIGIEDIYQVVAEYPENVLGFFSMNMINEYKSQGFGFVDMTHIYTASRLGLERDSSFFIPRYIAKKTAEDAEKFLPLKPAVEVPAEPVESEAEEPEPEAKPAVPAAARNTPAPKPSVSKPAPAVAPAPAPAPVTVPETKPVETPEKPVQPAVNTPAPAAPVSTEPTLVPAEDLNPPAVN